jgi:2Fe-2S ferredoxin
MPTIRFVKNYPPIEVEAGAELMDSLRRAGLPVASSCDGDGVCGRCRLVIVAGAENLSPLKPIEEILRTRLRLPGGVRISCQALVLGDVTVDASYW